MATNSIGREGGPGGREHKISCGVSAGISAQKKGPPESMVWKSSCQSADLLKEKKATEGREKKAQHEKDLLLDPVGLRLWAQKLSGVLRNLSAKDKGKGKKSRRKK